MSDSATVIAEETNAYPKLFKTSVLGVGPYCVEFADREILHTRSEERQRLIAAAPDLLDALRTFVTAAKSWHEFHHGSQTVQCDWICEAMLAGEAALAKAEGRS